MKIQTIFIIYILLNIGILTPSYDAIAVSSNNSTNDLSYLMENDEIKKNINNQLYWGFWWPEFPGRYEPFFNVIDINEVDADVYGLTTSDFNNDGLEDYAIAWSNQIHDENFQSYISIFYQNELRDGYFRNDIFSFNYTRIVDLDAADYDNDDDIDLLYTYSEYNSGYVNINGIGKLLLNDGAGNYSVEKTVFLHEIEDGIKKINPQISSADFDNDGDIDFIVGDNSGKVSFYKNDGLGNFLFSGESEFDNNKISWGISSGDFNNDGYIDFIVTGRREIEEGNIFLKYNDGSNNCFDHNNFIAIAELPAILYESFYSSAFPIADGCLCSIDYNKDGLLDLIYGGPGNLFLYVQQKNEIFEPFTVARFPEEKMDGGFNCNNLRLGGISVADLNNDGLEDLIVGGSHGKIRLFYNNYVLIDIVFPDRACKINQNEITSWLLPFYFFLKYGIAMVRNDITIIAKELQSLKKVEFYLDDKLVFTDELSPYEWDWNKIAFGIHNIKALAYDLNGNPAGYDNAIIYKLF